MRRKTENRLEDVLRTGKQLVISYQSFMEGTSIGTYFASWAGDCIPSHSGEGSTLDKAVSRLLDAMEVETTARLNGSQR